MAAADRETEAYGVLQGLLSPDAALIAEHLMNTKRLRAALLKRFSGLRADVLADEKERLGRLYFEDIPKALIALRKWTRRCAPPTSKRGSNAASASTRRSPGSPAIAERSPRTTLTRTNRPPWRIPERPRSGGPLRPGKVLTEQHLSDTRSSASRTGSSSPPTASPSSTSRRAASATLPTNTASR